MSPDDFVQRFAEAIARMEGFYRRGTPAQRNNNPGNLRSWGTRPIAKGFAVFETPEDGWEALWAQIVKNINRRLTLYEFFEGKPGVYGGYAPAADKNKPREYAEFVAKKLGIDADERLDVAVAKATIDAR